MKTMTTCCCLKRGTPIERRGLGSYLPSQIQNELSGSASGCSRCCALSLSIVCFVFHAVPSKQMFWNVRLALDWSESIIEEGKIYQRGHKALLGPIHTSVQVSSST
jgi:hypothetical protein